jgi:hypothetical protein
MWTGDPHVPAPLRFIDVGMSDFARCCRLQVSGRRAHRKSNDRQRAPRLFSTMSGAQYGTIDHALKA